MKGTCHESTDEYKTSVIQVQEERVGISVPLKNIVYFQDGVEFREAQAKLTI